MGGEGDPLAKVQGNRSGLLQLRDQIDAALRADEGMASSAAYRETDERRFDLFVQRADERPQMGEARRSRLRPSCASMRVTLSSSERFTRRATSHMFTLYFVPPA